MIVVMTGVLITAVDTTIVVLALPAIERDLHVALASVIWIIVGYLLVITVLATQVGRLGDMFGRVRMYEAGFAVFVLGGVIVTYVSWRWIFWINVPIGVAALALALRVLRDRGERVRHRLDWAGMITLGLGLFGVLWAMTRLAAPPEHPGRVPGQGRGHVGGRAAGV